MIWCQKCSQFHFEVKFVVGNFENIVDDDDDDDDDDVVDDDDVAFQLELLMIVRGFIHSFQFYMQSLQHSWHSLA